MATAWWTGNAANVAQADTLTVTAVAAGAVLSATINGKTVSYVCAPGDTVTTAAAAWLLLLGDRTNAPPEFQEITWANPSAGVVTATAATAGVPFTLTASASGGGGVTLAHTTPNGSQSDAGNAGNYLRGGVAMLPQAGDDLVLADSAVPVLYNLGALAGVALNSVVRWQSFTGDVGLPEWNPNGYYEYRGTYLKLGGPASGALLLTLGVGQTGAGPGRERYDLGGQLARVTVLGGGASSDAEASVRLLGTNAGNTLTAVGASVAVATLPGETSAFASVTADGGATVTLGPNCACTSLTLTGATGVCYGGVSSVVVQAGGQLLVQTVPGQTPAAGSGGGGTSSSSAGGTPSPTTLTYGTLLVQGGSTATWLSEANVTSLTLKAGGVFDKSGDLRPMTVTNCALDQDTCLVLDPNNAITFTNPISLNNASGGGAVQVGPGRTLKVT